MPKDRTGTNSHPPILFSKQWTSWALAVFVLTALIFCVVLSLASGVDVTYQPNTIGFGLVALSGALILKRQPLNRVGVALYVTGIVYVLSELFYVYSMLALVKHPGILPFGDITSWLASFFWMLGYTPTIAVFLLFPNGRPLSRRWWWLLALCALITLPLILLNAILLWPYRGLPIVQSNVDLTTIPTVGAVIRKELTYSQPILTLLLIGSVIGLFIRFRKARGIEQQQLKWILFACATVPLSTVLTVPFANNGNPLVVTAMQLINFLSVLSFPVAFAVSVTRYRLYDIDVIIRRTLVYSLLTITLAGLYFGSVLVLQEIFVAISGQRSPVSIVLSTLLIAALFSTLRRRIQRIIDRRFYRSQYNAAKMLESFGALQRESVELEQLQGRLVEIVDIALQPETVTLILMKK